jgi:hypothetical protein
MGSMLLFADLQLYARHVGFGSYAGIVCLRTPLVLGTLTAYCNWMNYAENNHPLES